MTKDVGRPKKEVDWRLLNSVLKLGATLIDCSDFLEVSEDTIQRRIKEKYDLTFSEYRDKKMSHMRIKLLQKQYDVAMEGNVSMLIWMSKQHLGQSDKQDQNINQEINVTIDQEDAHV